MTDDPVARYGTLFELDGARYVPTPLARGPWDPRALHGGAPSALFARACEQHDPGAAAFVARLTVELLRPVPLAPLTMRVRTLRPGHKVQWISCVLLDDDGRECARAVALRMRTGDVDVTGAVMPAVEPPPVRPPASAGEAAFPFGEGAVGYWTAHEIQIVRGSWTEPGPAAAWLRLRCPVVADEEPSPFVRVAASADFGSGVGNAARFTNAAAINAEVTIHVHRHPAGEWICLESSAWVEPHGVGMAETRLHDEHGVFGRAVQALLVEPITLRRIRA